MNLSLSTLADSFVFFDLSLGKGSASVAAQDSPVWTSFILTHLFSILKVCFMHFLCLSFLSLAFPSTSLQLLLGSRDFMDALMFSLLPSVKASTSLGLPAFSSTSPFFSCCLAFFFLLFSMVSPFLLPFFSWRLDDLRFWEQRGEAKWPGSTPFHAREHISALPMDCRMCKIMQISDFAHFRCGVEAKVHVGPEVHRHDEAWRVSSGLASHRCTSMPWGRSTRCTTWNTIRCERRSGQLSEWFGYVEGYHLWQTEVQGKWSI